MPPELPQLTLLRLCLSPTRSLRSLDRQPHSESRVSRLRFQLNRSMMFPDNPHRRIQPQPCSFSHLLRRKKRVEDLSTGFPAAHPARYRQSLQLRYSVLAPFVSAVRPFRPWHRSRYQSNSSKPGSARSRTRIPAAVPRSYSRITVTPVFSRCPKIFSVFSRSS